MIENLDNIAEIKFLPVCSKCNHIIRGTVNCEYSTAMSLSRAAFLREFDITPQKCEFCGRVFKSITIPTKLPYAYNDNI